MKVLIPCFGTRGDVAPFTGLGARLRTEGHDVVLAAHESFAPMASEAGLEFRPLAGDVRAILRGNSGQQVQRSGSGMVRAAQSLRQARDVAGMLNEFGESLLAASHDADVLMIQSITGVIGYNIAKAMGIRCMLTELIPSQLIPTGDFPLVNLGPYSFGRLGNRMVTRCVPALSSLFLGFIKDFQRRLGVPASGLAGMYREVRQQRWPILHGFSPQIVPRPADWWPGADVVGYWWPYLSPSWQPPHRLADFLESGPPPVFFGFGSMAEGQGERLSGIVSQAVRRCGVRAVVQAGWSGLTADGDDVLAIDDVPHGWLFPRMAAVVHHAGPGTVGASLRAGVPVVAATVFNDQPFWARQLIRAGVSPGRVPLRKLTADILTDLVGKAASDPAYQRRARSLAERIGAEDGAGSVAQALTGIQSVRHASSRACLTSELSPAAARARAAGHGRLRRRPHTKRVPISEERE